MYTGPRGWRGRYNPNLSRNGNQRQESKAPHSESNSPEHGRIRASPHVGMPGVHLRSMPTSVSHASKPPGGPPVRNRFHSQPHLKRAPYNDTKSFGATRGGYSDRVWNGQRRIERHRAKDCNIASDSHQTELARNRDEKSMGQTLPYQSGQTDGQNIPGKVITENKPAKPTAYNSPRENGIKMQQVNNFMDASIAYSPVDVDIDVSKKFKWHSTPKRRIGRPRNA